MSACVSVRSRTAAAAAAAAAAARVIDGAPEANGPPFLNLSWLLHVLGLMNAHRA